MGIITNEEKANFENIGGGLVSAQFAAELESALKNCMDLDTKCDVWREVTIKFKIKPNQERNRAEFEIQVSTKGAPPKPYSTLMAIGTEYGECVAYEVVVPKQEEIPFDNVSKLRKDN